MHQDRPDGYLPAAALQTLLLQLADGDEIFYADGRRYELRQWPAMRSARTGEVISDERYLRILPDGGRLNYGQRPRTLRRRDDRSQRGRVDTGGPAHRGDRRRAVARSGFSCGQPPWERDHRNVRASRRGRRSAAHRRRTWRRNPDLGRVAIRANGTGSNRQRTRRCGLFHVRGEMITREESVATSCPSR